MVTVVVTCLIEQNNNNANFHKNLPKLWEVFYTYKKYIKTVS